MIQRFRFASWLAAFALVWVGCGAQLATPQGEARAGAEAAAEVEQAIGLVDAPSLQTYVGAVGARLAQSPDVRRGVEYRFRVVDMTDPNAFALPGGYVYVSRGLLVLLNGEDELANVLAHELAHVSARHHLKHSLQQTPFVPLRIATGLAGAALQLVTLPLGPLAAPARPMGAMVGALGAAPGALYLASHSRAEENEADEIGQRLVSQAGWDPLGMARVMESLERDIRLRGGDPGQRSFLATHPSPPDRAQRTTARSRELSKADVPPIAGDRAHFYAALDGLLVGDAASNGFVDGSEFLHAELDLRLAFPEAWEIENGASAVAASPTDDAEGEEVFAILSVAGRGGDPIAVAREVLAKGSLDADGDVAPGKIGSLPSARAEGRSGRLPYRVLAHWIAHRDLVFQIVAAAPAESWERYEAPLRSVAQSFRPLAPGESARIREGRLRVVEAKRGESLAALVGRHSAAWDVPELAAANALPEQAVLSVHQPVKLAIWERYRAEANPPE